MSYLVLPMVIFFAELVVVTCGTLRIIFVSRGDKILAPIIGFVEVTTWLFAISQVMKNVSDVSCFFAFAGGFTVGNFLGILIEKKLAMGLAQVSIVMSAERTGLIDELRALDFGVTCVRGQGSQGPVDVVFTVVRRRQLPQVLNLVEAAGAFYAVDEVTSVSQGIFPSAMATPSGMKNLWRRFKALEMLTGSPRATLMTSPGTRRCEFPRVGDVIHGRTLTRRGLNPPLECARKCERTTWAKSSARFTSHRLRQAPTAVSSRSPRVSRTSLSRLRATCRRRLMVPTGVANSRLICRRDRPWM